MSSAQRRIQNRKLKYRIPAIWDCWGHDGPAKRSGKEIAVDPRSYFQSCLAWIRSKSPQRLRYAGRSLSQALGIARTGDRRVRDGSARRRAGDWIRRQIMYGMMIRTSSAWDHDANGRLTSRSLNELGTFCKSILLLPHLQRLGVTTLYLLPVVEASSKFRKGELGCPYAAKNFYELDHDLCDPLLGEEAGNLEAQFRLFCESAHRLGMRVMLDVAPRTASRDSDWIVDHPDWFYWIDRKFARSYKAPRLPGVSYLNPIPGRLDEVYDVPEVREHLSKFRYAPNVTHPREWANFARRVRHRPPDDLLVEIARHFGVITPPGFSDVINDTQPPWSDVTYLRLFHDHPTESARKLADPAAQPPYVLFDTAKASLFEGKRPIKPLWDKLAGIIPFYQRFGVDGARVDMAHALPAQLERAILDRPRRRDADFCFLAEELGIGNHGTVFRGGYNMIIGPSWYMQPRGHQGKMHEMIEQTRALKVPIMAAAETPDTPRAVVRNGRRKFSMQAVVVNNFLPNAVPMINSGIEVFERQPMNLGLDIVPPGRRALPTSDPLAGKLAFFDQFALHWNNTGGRRMTELIGRASALRRRFIKPLSNPRAYFQPKLTKNAGRILATGFRLGRRDGTLLMFANLDFSRRRQTIATGLRGPAGVPEVLIQIHDSPLPRRSRGRLSVTLVPGDVIVVRVGSQMRARTISIRT